MKQKLTAIASFTEFCLYFCVEWLKRFGYWGHSANTSRLKGNQNILVLLLFLTNTVLQILFFFSIFLNLLKGWDQDLNTHKSFESFWTSITSTARSWAETTAVSGRPSRAQHKVISPICGTRTQNWSGILHHQDILRNWYILLLKIPNYIILNAVRAS